MCCSNASEHRREARGFNADYLDRRPRLLDRAGYAGDQPAAAYGNHYRLELRTLFEQFETDGALSGDYGYIVECVHEGHAALGAERQSMLAGFVVIGAVQDYRGAEILRGGDLH